LLRPYCHSVSILLQLDTRCQEDIKGCKWLEFYPSYYVGSLAYPSKLCNNRKDPLSHRLPVVAHLLANHLSIPEARQRGNIILWREKDSLCHNALTYIYPWLETGLLNDAPQLDVPLPALPDIPTLKHTKGHLNARTAGRR